MLFPGADLLARRDELLGPLELEGRADPDGTALFVENGAERPLAQAPADCGEIAEIDAAVEENGIQTMGGHQRAGPLLAGFVVLGAQRGYALDHVLKRGGAGSLGGQALGQPGE